MTKMQLGVIFGGRSVEHEVSVVSAMEMIEAADPDRFDVVPFGVTRDGRWLTPEETRRQLDRDDPPFRKRLEADVPRLVERHDLFAQLASVDVLFPLVHGINGEDGTLQGMLEMFGLPYAGCGVAASAIGMDKGLQKHLLAEGGIDVAPYIELREAHWRRDQRGASLHIEQAVGYPAFVKPANGGSSVGVSKVQSREDLEGAMQSAFAVDAKVPYNSYIEASAIPATATGEEEARRSALLAEHAKRIKAHVDALAAKHYFTGLEASPEFTIAFIPNEPLLAAALEKDPTLLEYAFSKRIALASPVSFWAVLKTVAFTWQQEVLTDEAKLLFDLSKELYTRVAKLAEHADALGGAIERSVKAYNQFASSLESRVLVTARRLDGLDESKVIAAPRTIDEQPKQLTAPELTESIISGSISEEGSEPAA